MAAPAPQPGYPYAYRTAHSWLLVKLLCLIAAVCLFIAALEFAVVLHGGAYLGWAWAAGGVSAFFLGWAIP